MSHHFTKTRERKNQVKRREKPEILINKVTQTGMTEELRRVGKKEVKNQCDLIGKGEID
jgi:hypothetical protein